VVGRIVPHQRKAPSQKPLSLGEIRRKRSGGTAYKEGSPAQTKDKGVGLGSRRLNSFSTGSQWSERIEGGFREEEFQRRVKGRKKTLQALGFQNKDLAGKSFSRCPDERSQGRWVVGRRKNSGKRLALRRNRSGSEHEENELVPAAGCSLKALEIVTVAERKWGGFKHWEAC